MPEMPGPDWVLLRTLIGGVCGTDLALIRQQNHPATILQAFASFPAVLGHENVSRIETVGPDVTGWTPGRRVCVEPALGCAARRVGRPCGPCGVGRPSLCEHPAGDGLSRRALIGLNATTGGSWASHFVAHQSQLHAVPDDVSDDTALLTDPIASATHAVLRRRPQDDETVLINGAGVMAFGVAVALRALGHRNRVTMVVRHEYQADIATRLGADCVLRHTRRDSAGRRYRQVAECVGGEPIAARFGNQALVGGFDLVFDCTGTGKGLTDAIKWTRSRGTVVVAGTSGIVLLDSTPIWFDEIHVVGSNGRQIEHVDGECIHTYELVLRWMSNREIDLSPIGVTRFPLEQYRTAFARLRDRGRHRITKLAFVP